MILISGATGRVGTAACLALDKANIPFRVLVRDPEKFVLKESANVDVVTGDLENEGDVKAAMEGVSKALLLMSNNPAQAEIEKQFACVAGQSGVQHLVKISSMEASPEVTAALPKLHYESEQAIQSLDLAWTFLRSNFYMQNMLMYSVPIAKAGVFALPLGSAKTAMVDARDVGAVAAAVLQESEKHKNKIYKLTGPELIDFDEVAQRLSDVLGKKVSYIKQTPNEFRAVIEQFIHSKWQLDAVCELFQEIADGSLEHMTSDVEQILHRAPTSFIEFTKDSSVVFD